ncbi:MAG TPA: SRPBCC family protein [Saprospiraceae bacterium]|nr:SRPBCC family protein [Saprospiraceae bacterium]HPR01697.1 SRPBCC family protein [Saprospiraceae bacterium]HRV84807.1 SRPBCC family protein [Saprospiraceae bacterium]
MHMQVKKWEMTLPITLEEAWQFFSRPENLGQITPPEMNFKVLSDLLSVPMYAGMVIRYRLTPLLGIPASWVTEITQVNEPFYFVDEQRFGPYRYWHHEHHFEIKDDGILMTDLLHYVVPFGFIGKWIDKWLISKKIDQIFAYRKNILAKMFTQ